MSYADRLLPNDPQSWLLYLEDDVFLSRELPALLPDLIRIGARDNVDCWYLCNRKNPVTEQYRNGTMVINRLEYPVHGSHGLLLPKRHLRTMLDSHWNQTADLAMFAAIYHSEMKILQVVQPVLVEHLGEISTYNPQTRMKLEVNHAD